jgi:hypothetical protein
LVIEFKWKNRRTNNDLQNIALKTKEHNDQFKLKYKNRRTNNDLQNIALKTKDSLVLSAMFCRSLFVLLFFHLNWPLCSLALCSMLCRSLFVLLFFSLNWSLCSLETKEHNGQFKLKNRTNNDLQNIALKTKEDNDQFKLKRSLFVLLFLYFNLNWSLCSLVLSAMFCRSLFVLLDNGQFKWKNRRTNKDQQNIALKTKEDNGQLKLKNRRTNKDQQNIALKTKDAL